MNINEEYNIIEFMDHIKNDNNLNEGYNLVYNNYEKEFKAIDKLIKVAKNIYIAAHIGPDADAIGSTLAMKEAIKEKYKKEAVVAKDDSKEVVLKKSDLVILLDVGDIARTALTWTGEPTIVRIDHHATGMVCDVTIEDVEAGSACGLITLFLSEMNYPINKNIGELLFKGIIADTGRMQYSLSKVTIMALGILSEIGIDYRSIYNNMYMKSQTAIKAKTYLLSNYLTSPNGVSYIYVDNKIAKVNNFDMEELVQMPHELEGIKGSLIWMICVQRGSNINCRVRSRYIDLRSLANKYNGGGHANAVGIKVKNKNELSHLIDDLDELVKETKMKNPLLENTISLDEEFELYEDANELEFINEYFNTELNEGVDRREKRRFKLLKYLIKFLTEESLKEVLESLDLKPAKNKKEMIKQLRTKLDNLSPEVKTKITNNEDLIKADETLKKKLTVVNATSGGATPILTTGAAISGGYIGIKTAVNSVVTTGNLAAGIVAPFVAIIGLLAGAIIGGVVGLIISSSATVATNVGVKRHFAVESKETVKKILIDDLKNGTTSKALTEAEEVSNTEETVEEPVEEETYETKYKAYIEEHVNNVHNSFVWIQENCPELLQDCNVDYLAYEIQNHDASKYSDEEFIPYAKYFYTEKDDYVIKDFNVAWNHHQKTNKHHWEYWILRDDDKNIPLDIPVEEIVHMICDWMSFGFKNNDLLDIGNYYQSHKDLMLFSPKTKKTLEDYLQILVYRINEIEGSNVEE